MAEPKKRKSHSASRLKRAKQKFSLPRLIKCSHCKQPVLPHRVCLNCGYYKGKKVLDLEEKIKTKIKSKKR